MQEITHSKKMVIAARASEKLNRGDVEKLCMSIWGRGYRKELKKLLGVSDARLSQVFKGEGGGFLLDTIYKLAREHKRN